MDSGDPSIRPLKRRKTRKGKPLIDGDDAALNTVMVDRITVDTPAGPVQRKTLVPMRLDETEQDKPHPFQDPTPDDFSTNNEDDRPESGRVRRAKRGQSFYMQEFVDRVDGLLQALLAREALPNGNCSRCGERPGRWRCADCFQPHQLCRQCMRHSHMENPFHRIQRWTGTYFRPASLWEVGVYIQLGHKDSSNHCPHQQRLVDVLELFQTQDDLKDEVRLDNPLPNSLRSDARAGPIQQPDDAAQDAAFIRQLNVLYEQKQGFSSVGPDALLEEDDEDGPDDPEADLMDEDIGITGFATYMDMNEAADSDEHARHPPLTDGLNNTYVRIIHTNGVHHLALVSCSCHGDDGLAEALVYASLMPTSFKRVRTLFTLAVLDQFRYSNLELKASAYQFFQMLRRVTSPMAPATVVNFYHELRRLSRLWRWMKKLKWAGFGHKTADPLKVTPGELAIFCPACPQAGINLPDNWRQDSKSWVYRRFFAVDGNFKADHVRQKNPAPDVWLSEGGGMMARRDEYQNFLRTAHERSTVSTAAGSGMWYVY